MLGAVLDWRSPFFTQHGLEPDQLPDRRSEQTLFRPRGFKLRPLVEVSFRIDRMTVIGAEVLLATSFLHHPARRAGAHRFGSAFLEFMIPRPQLGTVEPLLAEASKAAELADSSESAVAWMQPGQDFALALEDFQIRSGSRPGGWFQVAVVSEVCQSKPWWKSLFGQGD